MSGPISKTEIINVTHQAINQAFDTHHMMSGGGWLDSAPEYYVTTSIANALANLDGAKYVTLEWGMKNAMENAGAVSRGRYSYKIRRNGRCDILFWWGNETPRAIIEVKSPLYSFSRTVEDLHRIEHLLVENHQQHTFQFGLFCFYSSWADNSRRVANEALDNCFNDILSKAENLLTKCSVEGSKKIYSRENESGAWMSGCLCISAK